MQTMLEQVNEKRIALNQQVSDTGKVVLKDQVRLNFMFQMCLVFNFKIIKAKALEYHTFQKFFLSSELETNNKSIWFLLY